jgi:hypothetical protein
MREGGSSGSSLREARIGRRLKRQSRGLLPRRDFLREIGRREG